VSAAEERVFSIKKAADRCPGLLSFLRVDVRAVV
jgi:hypothetical protein